MKDIDTLLKERRETAYALERAREKLKAVEERATTIAKHVKSGSTWKVSILLEDNRGHRSHYSDFPKDVTVEVRLDAVVVQQSIAYELRAARQAVIEAEEAVRRAA